MKIDLPNLIYIIAIIVWVIVGFVRKNKKKEGRPATTMPPVGEPQQPEFGDILEEILGKKKAEEKKPKPIPVPQQKQKPSKKKKVFQQIKTLETITGTDSVQRSIIRKKEKEISPVAETQILKSEHAIDVRSIFEEQEFDLRKAIIYSEIMKPPHQ